MINEEYLTIPAKKLPKGSRSFNEFIYTEVFKANENDIKISDFLYHVSTLWKTEKFNSFLKYVQTIEDLEYKNPDFRFVSAYYRRCLQTCPVCGKESLYGHCSLKCSNSDPNVQKRKSQTVFSHFGVLNSGQSEIVKEKSKQTCLEKYGTEYSFQAESVKEKIKETSMQKYGVDHPMKSESVKERQKSVIREHLGVDYPMQSKEVQEKSRQTCLEKYGTDNISKSEHFQDVMFNLNFDKYHKNKQDFNAEYVRKHFVENSKFKIKEFSEYFGICSRVVANRFKKKLGIFEQNNDNIG